uniref:ATP synthase F0 subunit 8 n=1 Tax=Whitmania acranulata TaxID=1329092 RepID=A0A0F6PBT0_WHICA|nr:ATP synthase F0 subunit 8 [Whitmania acranulata]
MPQLSPLHWIFAFISLWLLMFHLISMLWWLSYVVYLKLNYSFMVYSIMK